MLHLEAEWTSKQNILIADTILAEPGPQPGFKVGGEKYFLRGKVIFITCLKQIFQSTTKYGDTKKIWG